MVARTLNVTRSAERLNFAQSSVTEQIQGLERDIGATLFERRGRRLRLTAAGERLLAYADRMLALAAEARTEVAAASGSAVTTTVRLAAPETLCAQRLPAVLARLRGRTPHVRLAVRAASRAELHRAIPDGAADVCLGIGDAPADRAVVAEALAPEPLVLVAAASHPLADRDAVSVEALRSTTWLATERGCAYREAFERGLGAGTPSPVAEVSSIRSLAACVAAGEGIALVPEVAVADELARGTLVRLPWAPPGASTCAVWLGRAAGMPTDPVATVVAAVRETLLPAPSSAQL